MPASSKKNKDAHRVVCQCKSRQCYLGHYIDPHGQTRPGVEVLPSTRDAHAQADLRKQVLEGNSEAASSANPRQQTLDDLVGPFERFHLPSQDSPPGIVASESATDSARQRTRFPRNPEGRLRLDSGLPEHVAPVSGGTQDDSNDIDELPQHADVIDTQGFIPSYDCGK